MDERSIRCLEFDRVAALVAKRAACARAASRLAAARPLADAAARALEIELLHEAIRRTSAPGRWCAVGEGVLVQLLAEGRDDGFEPAGLRVVAAWIGAARATAELWNDADVRDGHPHLAERVASLPDLGALGRRIEKAIEPDGRVSDAASEVLARSRAEFAGGERQLEERLTRWASKFGAETYVTRRAERFVALVPAAGFARRGAIVHDVSGSGGSLFVEPAEACEANNRLIELKGRIYEEERRIVAELAGAVLDVADALETLEDVLAHLDSLRARAGWALEVGAIAIRPGGDRLRLVQARHPLLAAGERRDAIVPLDLQLEADGRLLLVSGPNMGGKTVLLKTVGLAVLMSHSALPVPAEQGSEIPVFDQVVVDLGDGQSVDAGLSTFAAHLENLGAMAAAAGPRTLVLADELGSGTDPDEGAAIGRALIEHFAARRSWGVLTTHLGQLKRAAGGVEGVVSGSLEYDAEKMRPRYRFLAGVPGASHGIEIAARMGFPEPILSRARILTPDAVASLEALLGELQETARTLHEERDALRAARAEAEAAAIEHRRAADHARASMHDLKDRLTRESEALLAQVRELWQTIRREARRAERSRARTEEVGADVAAVEASLDALRASARAAAGAEPESARVDAAKLTLGQRVRVTDLGIEAEVAGLPDETGRLTLRRGSWSIQSHVDRLAPAEESEPKASRAGTGVLFEVADDAAPLEVNLLGMDVDEAIRTLDTGLDRAVVAGLRSLRIIHGLGKGVLRAAVERHLRGHPQVAGQRLGEMHEGGRGVTVAELR